MNFIEKCVAGLVKPEEIHDYIAQWHDSPKWLPIHMGGTEAGEGKLNEFLGFTETEYALWVECVEMPFHYGAHKKTRRGELCGEGLRDADNEYFLQAIVLSRKRDTSVIPKGTYCYTRDGKGGTTSCPYLFSRPSMLLDPAHGEQESGYCAFLQKGDWMDKDGTMLLWDACKECGINDDLEEEVPKAPEQPA